MLDFMLVNYTSYFEKKDWGYNNNLIKTSM